MTLRGTCACGRVAYEICGPLIGPLTFCHCWRCRKQSGSSFGTTAGVLTADFRITAGDDLMRAWESSPGIHRHFAGCCGSPLYKTDAADPDELGFRLGTLDVDPGLRSGIQFLTGSAVPWLDLRDDFDVQHGGPPFGRRDAPHPKPS